MEYVSDEGKSPSESSKNGYWVFGKKVYDVTTGIHVKLIVEHPELFNLTAEKINEAYARHKEPLGSEGAARDELIRLAASLGWIRVRHYTGPWDNWSFQCHDTVKQRGEIKEFAAWAIQNGIIKENDHAVMVGFKEKDDRHEYKWEEGGIQVFLAGKE